MNTLSNNQFNITVNTLKEASKKHSSLRRSFINELCEFMKTMENSINIVNKKFKLNSQFFYEFCNTVANNNTEMNENEYYKHFLRLKKFGLIHKNSSNFPKALTLISINPNPKFFLTEAYSSLDRFKMEKKLLINNIQDKLNLEDLYIYLRLYSEKVLKKSELESIDLQNIIKINKNLCLLAFIEKDFFGFETYNLHFFDKAISKVFFNNLINSSTEKIFENIEFFEKKYQEYKQERFEGINYHELMDLNMILNAYDSSTVQCLLKARKIQTVKLTITDVTHFDQNIKIPKHLLDLENKMIKNLNSNLEEDDEKDTIDVSEETDKEDGIFLISEIEALKKFLGTKEIYITTTLFNEVKKEFEFYKSDADSKHVDMILSYIEYLINFVKSRKLRASTVKGYIGILNKYLFKRVINLEIISQEEYDYISYKLNHSNLKNNTQKKYVKVIKRFFSYYNRSNISLNCSAITYPKSLVFKDEIIQIINQIENNYIERNKITRISKHDKLDILQHQILVILGFYSGMRKNEIRSRLLSDIFVNDSYIQVDVNNKGLRKLKMKLKTTQSKRRIPIFIDDEFQIYFTNWYNLRKSMQTNNPFLFIQRSNNGFYKKRVVPENSIDFINEIISQVTNRYATFHSLRHSFCTYTLINLLQNIETDPYSILKLSTLLGHITPDVTMSAYIHFDIIRLYQSINIE